MIIIKLKTNFINEAFPFYWKPSLSFRILVFRISKFGFIETPSFETKTRLYRNFGSFLERNMGPMRRILLYCIRSWNLGREITNIVPQIEDLKIYENAGTSNRALLGYNPGTHHIFLVFRGTIPTSLFANDLTQDALGLWLTDYNHDGCTNCKVGKGFYDATQI